MACRKTRTETDSMGSIEVPADRYWGAETQRCLLLFSVGNDRFPLEMVHSIAIVKKAAAMANAELGVLASEKAALIIRAADEVITGRLDTHFPLQVWMGGSGTQANMNVNEVLANRAIEISGGTMGSRHPVDPHDDVNRSQSTNDVFPAAMHLTTARLFRDRLVPSVRMMRDELDVKARAWEGIVKLGRTHLQDAVPMTLGQEFGGYARLLEGHLHRIDAALQGLHPLALGGTAVGTGLNAPAGFDVLVIEKVRELTGVPFVAASDKFALMGSHDALAAAGSCCKGLAGSLYKIANDIRFLGCGPRAGIHELILPPNEPGSSIMPGKVNPTQCEAMAMAALQVMAYEQAISLGNAGGHLEMNAYKPLIIYNIVRSVHLLSNSCTDFTRHLLADLKPDLARIDRYVWESLMLVTALGPVIGYDRASALARYADEHNCTLKEANAVLGYLPAGEIERLLDPVRMAHPNRKQGDA